VDGVLLVDKPAGKTSHDVVAGVRRVMGRGVKVGHAGTLDPFATGLLLVLVGRATRVQRYLMALPKTYVTEAVLGASSTTGDPEGEITVTGKVPADPPPLAVGPLLQCPPAYSAVKVDGRRAYARARAGESFELEPREVCVHRFEQTRRDGDARAEFLIQCSAGTYVRALIAALGDAYCASLRRLAIGPFGVGDAVTPAAVRPALLLGIGDALAFLPRVELEGEDARRAAHGVSVAGETSAPEVVLADADGPIAVAEPRAGGMLKPVVGFRA
jgi:tRNA pseudouridine55 synthase